MRSSVSSESTGVISSDSAVPVARRLRQRPQLVVAPRVLLVRLPRVEKLGANLGRHGGAIDWRRGEYRRCGEEKDDGGDA